MKLFCVVGEIKGEDSVIKHYVAKSKYEATERFISDCRQLNFFNISITEIEEIDGFCVNLKQPNIGKATIGDKPINIKCCKCTFGISVPVWAEIVVCPHCRTVNDVNLQLNLQRGPFNNE